VREMADLYFYFKDAMAIAAAEDGSRWR
jgi:hypothetical protein